jgi:hypothetical protein
MRSAQCETLCDSSINASRDCDREHTPLICRLFAHVEGANSVNFAYCFVAERTPEVICAASEAS